MFKGALISMRLFCPCKSEESEYFSEICEYSYISCNTHSQQLYTNSQTFWHLSHHFSTCIPTISEYFITCPCTISTHFWIFDAISIHHTNICRTFGNTWTLIPSILQHSQCFDMHPRIFLLHQDAHPAFFRSPFFPIKSVSFAYLLKFSIDFGSIVKHSYSLPPFSEINSLVFL